VCLTFDSIPDEIFIYEIERTLMISLKPVLPMVRLVICMGVAVSFSQTAVSAETVRIFTGGPALIKLILSHKPDFEKAGITVEVRGSDARQAAKFLSGGQIDGITSALPPEATFKAGGLDEKADNYKFFDIYQTKINVALNPANKVDALTHAQVAGILSGKTKSWKELGGDDRQIQVLYLKTNFGLLNEIRTKYLAGGDLKIGEGVTEKDGLLRRLEKDSGAMGVVSGNDDMPNFKPKFIATELSYPLYFITKKAPSAAMEKVYEILKAK
jgi:ABC-type phosphate transport system substrate-binding protein